jgi:hypothetical protein
VVFLLPNLPFFTFFHFCRKIGMSCTNLCQYRSSDSCYILTKFGIPSEFKSDISLLPKGVVKMLNRTKALSTGLLLSGMLTWAPAQTDYTGTSTLTAPASSAIVAPRTGEYPGAINGAADNTVDDYTKRGTLINGKQYFAGWGGADLVNGAYSFQAIGFDWFGAVNASTSAGNGTWRSGIATSRFAAGLLLNFNKTTSKVPAGETKNVIAGDGFGLFGDFNLGNSDVYGEVSLLTGPGNYQKTPTTETTPTTLHFMGGWKKDATSEGTHSLNVELVYDHTSIEVETPSSKTSGNEVKLTFSHGYILKSGTGYSVFLGSNSNFMYAAQDLPGATSDPSHMGLSVAPNLVFHKALSEHFEFTSGASARLSYDTFENTGAFQENSALLTSDADINLGLRWVKDNFSVQGSLNESLLSTGPNFITGGGAPTNTLFGQVGVSLGF